MGDTERPARRCWPSPPPAIPHRPSAAGWPVAAGGTLPGGSTRDSPPLGFCSRFSGSRRCWALTPPGNSLQPVTNGVE